MNLPCQLSLTGSASFLGLGLLFASLPNAACAQTAAQVPPAYSRIISIAPIELFYKTQLGYEHRWGQRNSLGLLGSYHYGNVGGYKGWQTTSYYRRFLTGSFPIGLYVQAQASVFNFSQTANLIDVKTKEPFAFEYRAVSAGAGVGCGYRGQLLRQAFGGRLLYNAMVGLRYQHQPSASYSDSDYRPKTGFLGETDDANWHLGFGPGSAAHGLFTLDYQF